MTPLTQSRLIFSLLLTLFIITGCLDSSSSISFDNEDDIKFLEETAKEEGVERTESGLLYKIIEEGEGEQPDPDSKVKVYYTGMLISGQVFDRGRSREREEAPAEFSVNGVIYGFGEGLQLIGEGGKIELYIPTELGYGAFPPPYSPIYPGAALVFEVELVEVL